MAVKKAQSGLTKIQQMMSLSGMDLRDQRNVIQYKRLTNALGNKLRDLTDAKDEVDLSILSLTDFGAKSTTSLRVSDVDAPKWLEELAGFYSDLRDIEDELEIYSAIQDNLFTVEGTVVSESV